MMKSLADSPAPAAPPAARGLLNRWRFELLALAVIAAVYLSGAANRTFWAENEAYYALGAQSVLKGNILLPVIYNEMFADKPPFMFWWVALVSFPFGQVTEFTARLANILPSLAVLALVIWFARVHIGGTRAALLSAVVLATSHEFYEVASEVNTDMLLVALLFLSWTAMFRLMENGFTWRRWLLLWVPMSVGMLTKGPVAPALSGLVACVFAFWSYGWREGWRRLWSLRPVTGAVLCVLPLSIWCGLVWKMYGFGPIETILLKHNVQRFVAAFDHVKPWYYYFEKLPVIMLPWTLFIPVAALQWWRRRKSGTAHAPWQIFAASTVMVIFVFFSASSSKRAYYLLPLMPWLALLLGESMSRIGENMAELRSQQRAHRLVTAGAAFTLALLTVYITVGYPVLDKRRSPGVLIAEIQRTVDQDDHLIIFAEEDPRLMFYLEEDFSYFGETPAQLQAMERILNTRPEVDVLLPRRSLKLMKEIADVPLFVEGTALYRDDRYYVLTTEANPRLRKFDQEYLRSQTSGRKKRRGAARSSSKLSANQEHLQPLSGTEAVVFSPPGLSRWKWGSQLVSCQVSIFGWHLTKACKTPSREAQNHF